MPTPTKLKTWQYNCNNLSPAQGSAVLSNKRVLRLLKDALKGFASNPWTVQRSSNSVVANTSDNWTTDGDLVGGGGAHSWMVLQQTGIAPGFQLCIDLNSASSNVATIVVSPAAGFTGGTTSARPTATDEIVLVSLSTWTTNSSDVGIRWSVMQSSDGECTRIMLAAAGAITLFAAFDKPANPSAGWTNPSVSLWSISQTTGQYFGYNARMKHGAITGSVAMLVDGTGTIAPSDTTWGNIANEITLEWPIYALSFACSTAGARGKHGAFYDLWAGSVAVATGETYPLATNDFVQVGPLVLPWDGGAVNLS